MGDICYLTREWLFRKGGRAMSITMSRGGSCLCRFIGAVILESDD